MIISQSYKHFCPSNNTKMFKKYELWEILNILVAYLMCMVISYHIKIILNPSFANWLYFKILKKFLDFLNKDTEILRLRNSYPPGHMFYFNFYLSCNPVKLISLRTGYKIPTAHPTLCCRVPQKPNVTKLIKKYHAFYWMQMFITIFTTACHWTLFWSS
jgi:hypothetical protein